MFHPEFLVLPHKFSPFFHFPLFSFLFLLFIFPTLFFFLPFVFALLPLPHNLSSDSPPQSSRRLDHSFRRSPSCSSHHPPRPSSTSTTTHRHFAPHICCFIYSSILVTLPKLAFLQVQVLSLIFFVVKVFGFLLRLWFVLGIFLEFGYGFMWVWCLIFGCCGLCSAWL